MNYIILLIFLLFNLVRFLGDEDAERPDFNKFNKTNYCQCKQKPDKFKNFAFLMLQMKCLKMRGDS